MGGVYGAEGPVAVVSGSFIMLNQIAERIVPMLRLVKWACITVIGSFVLLMIVGNVQGSEMPLSDKDGKWKVVGELVDGLKTTFVEISAKYAKSRGEYDRAVNALCANRQICVVAFYLPGDPEPSTMSSKTFESKGGFETYDPVVLWWENKNTGMREYTQWNCNRAGAEESPASSLCGDRVKEIYGAVLSLGSRAGTSERCGWEKHNDLEKAKAYISGVQKPDFRKTLEDGLMKMYNAGKDGLTSCVQLKRDVIERKANEALAILKLD